MLSTTPSIDYRAGHNSVALGAVSEIRQCAHSAAIPLFDSLNDDELLLIVNNSVVVNQPAGELLTHHAGDGPAMFVVISGEVESSIENGAATTLAEGATMGEVSFFLELPLPITFRTTKEKAVLLIFNGEAMSRIERESPELATKILTNLCKSLCLKTTNQSLT